MYRKIKLTFQTRESAPSIFGALTLSLLRPLFVSLFCAIFLMGRVNLAESQKFHEYEVKAVFLYNFAKYIEWPSTAFESAEAPIIIGVIGNGNMADALASMTNKTAGGRRILIKIFESSDELSKCHILFVPSSEREHLPKILRAIKNLNVLTVGEIKGSAKTGLLINFYIEEDNVRFEINPDAAERGGLKISSQLLKLARIVKEGH